MLKTMHDDHFRQLLNEFNYSWSGYRKVRKGVKKRLSRHMLDLNCSGIQAYLDLIRSNESVRQECALRMTVSISRFLRDRQLWAGLEGDILPRIIKEQHPEVRVWSAGCARGEEVYSLRIIWDRLSRRHAQLPALRITSTDKNPDYLRQARAGVYTKGSLKEVSAELRERYFNSKKSGRQFSVKAFVNKGIDWKVQDIFADPPGSGYDIILLRNNLLTYYKATLVEEGFDKVVKALKANGWLIVGSHEKLPASASSFRRHEFIPWAYRRERY